MAPPTASQAGPEIRPTLDRARSARAVWMALRPADRFSDTTMYERKEGYSAACSPPPPAFAPELTMKLTFG